MRLTTGREKSEGRQRLDIRVASYWIVERGEGVEEEEEEGDLEVPVTKSPRPRRPWKRSEPMVVDSMGLGFCIPLSLIYCHIPTQFFSSKNVLSLPR